MNFWIVNYEAPPGLTEEEIDGLPVFESNDIDTVKGRADLHADVNTVLDMPNATSISITQL